MSGQSIIRRGTDSSLLRTAETTQYDENTYNSTPKKSEKIFIYETPAIKIKNELIMPSTPRKITKHFNSNVYLGKGRNLLELFEAL